MNTPTDTPAKSPEAAAQEAMRPPLPKRFYKEVTISAVGDETDNHHILLDGRSVKTPGKNQVMLPNAKAAELVAVEWRAQGEHINPITMPMTRLVNTAIDGIAVDPQPVIEDMLKFASSDLLCYRVSTPEGLVSKQRQHWDPVLDWLEKETGERFNLSEGIAYIDQPKSAIAAIGQKLRQWQDPIAIGALHTFSTMTGSVFLGLVLAEQQLNAEQAWDAAHVDEDWNISQWGEDYEAQSRRAKRWQEFEASYRLFCALESVPN